MKKFIKFFCFTFAWLFSCNSLGFAASWFGRSRTAFLALLLLQHLCSCRCSGSCSCAKAKVVYGPVDLGARSEVRNELGVHASLELRDGFFVEAEVDRIGDDNNGVPSRVGAIQRARSLAQRYTRKKCLKYWLFREGHNKYSALSVPTYKKWCRWRWTGSSFQRGE